MPKRKLPDKVKKNPTEMYIIFILWLAIASTFLIIGYLNGSMGMGATASTRRIPKLERVETIPARSQDNNRKPPGVTTTPDPVVQKYPMDSMPSNMKMTE